MIDSACVTAKRRLAAASPCASRALIRAASRLASDVAHERQEPAARLGQLDRMRPAVDEVDADPLLERADVARERGLRDEARLRRAREVTALRQRQEILDPLEVERSVVGSHRSAVNNSMRF